MSDSDKQKQLDRYAKEKAKALEQLKQEKNIWLIDKNQEIK